ncbi:uncharacterized protein LOC109824082 [Asparagus officinalis]|uniref:uncharacterized protein LOC109824082 n=1 Tax=Asparagus officinalis TaxID=4686 RepID=UPI00098E3053|nr:uncharacterized protein LOC109824082 [Asparagus officinalis]
MELHSPTSAKKLWNILRIAFFMMRKGLVAKRKLILDMNLVMKRGKILRKSIGNLMFHYNHDHHHRSRNSPASLGHGFGLREYEFSCTNSPNPVFFRASSKRRHSYFFPCITASSADEADDYRASPAIVLPRIEFSPQCSTYNLTELAPGHDRNITPIRSPLSVRVSNFSLAEEGDGSSCEVDSQAEEFIRKFYQQLQAQGRIAMLQCQEDEYRELMLAS